ncbi:MAG: hypothetical protein U1E18_17650 [Brevundimonas sp.]|uniref:hypothetical protein n=1 Tax=Brevundimonas sp. TaxID=1871086 RepID=UPI002ABA7242|nr:hypothetical protein [Brevundimonas sp.]MDZ4111406.1 hypothetical protein [Brevundimonas sp.]
MGNLALGNNDYMAVTRAMDGNRNNRIDQSEANVTWAAHRNIGNSNGVAGTRETADALARGDVYITSLPAETAEKVALYFSDRASNENKMPKDWTGDSWISKEDLAMPDHVRSAIDTNYDNRVSRSEFAAALTTGRVSIGRGR